MIFKNRTIEALIEENRRLRAQNDKLVDRLMSFSDPAYSSFKSKELSHRDRDIDTIKAQASVEKARNLPGVVDAISKLEIKPDDTEQDKFEKQEALNMVFGG